MDKSKLSILLKVLLGLGLLALLAQLDLAQVVQELARISPAYLLGLALLQLLTMVLLGYQWQRMARLSGYQTSFFQAFMINNWGNLIDAITPGTKVGGELARFSLLKRQLGLANANGALILALQKVISISSFYVLSLLSIGHFVLSIQDQNKSLTSGILWVLLSFGLLFSLFFLLIFHKKTSLLIQAKWKDSRLASGIAHFQQEVGKLATSFRGNQGLLARELVLGLLIWALYGFKLYLILWAFQVPLDFLKAQAITNISYMVGMLPLLPGSIGSFEAPMVLLLSTQGIGLELSLSITLVFRLLTFWMEFLLSSFFVLAEKIKNHLDPQQKGAL